MTTPFYYRTTKYFFIYNLKQANFVSRSAYELLLFEVSVNEIEVKRLKDLLDVGVRQGITGN